LERDAERHKLAVKRFATIAIYLCLVFSGIGQVQAFSCSPRPPPEINSAKDYVWSFADTLVLLRAARNSTKELNNPNNPAPSREFIAVLKTAGQQYDCAKSYLAPYTESKNDSVAESAKLMNAGTTTLGSVNNIFLQRYKESLDGKSDDRSTHEETNAQLIKLGNEASSLAIYATNAACLALIKFDDNKNQRLTLTAQERAALIKTIEKNFQHLPAKTAQVTSPLDSSVLFLLNFLKDMKRKSHDDR
jgi:hypothetical protein